MNKKDIAEIKKNFTPESGFFTLNRVVAAYIDAERNVHCKTEKSFALLSEEETEVLFETLRKTLSGSIGKNLKEYPFPNESYEEGGAQNILYTAVRSKFEDAEAVDKVIDRIRENLEYDAAYCIILAHCSYSMMIKDKNDDSIGESDSEFNFCVVSVCPMNTNTDGLYYNSDDNAICKKNNTDLIISRVPTDGFMYPIFSGRAPDVNNVVYYAKSAKKPNISMIEDVLDCSFEMTAEDEKEAFRSIVQNVVGDELDYTKVTKINEIIRDIAAQNTEEAEAPMVDEPRLRSVFTDAGVSPEKIEGLTAAYETVLGSGSKGMTAANLIENKTVVAVSGITVNIGKDSENKIRTGVIGGRKCLIIDLDDPAVTVNGMDTPIDQDIETSAETEENKDDVPFDE